MLFIKANKFSGIQVKIMFDHLKLIFREELLISSGWVTANHWIFGLLEEQTGSDLNIKLFTRWATSKPLI